MSNGVDDKSGGGGPQSPFEWPKGWPKPPKPPGGWKFSLIYIAVIVLGLSMFHSVVAGRGNPPIDFSEFMARIESGEIRRVRITDSFFVGFTAEAPREAVPRRMPGVPQTLPQAPVYRTVPVNHPELIRLMDAMGVSYYAVPRDGAAILTSS